MQVTAEQTDPCTIVLDIVVDEQQVVRAFETSYREFGRFANVPGFRPGKAPRAIVERFVDSERVRQHTLEKIIRDSYPKAVEEQGINPYRDPLFDPTDLEDKKPYTYKATIPLEPQVTLGDYTGLTVEKPVFPVTEEMVETQLQRLREERSRLDRVTDRGVQEGDVLIAESQTVLEGDENPAPPRRQLIQMGSNIPGFDEAVMGMMPGEERSFELTFPEDHEEEDRRGKKATFTVKLSSLSAKKMPELNEDFARQVAGVETVDELKQSLRDRLEAESERLGNEMAEQRLIEKILENSDIHFPAVLAREDVEENLRQLGADLQKNNVSYAQYLAQIGRTQEEHQTGLFTQAELQIRSLLALRHIAQAEGLYATNEAINSQFANLLHEGRINEEQYEEYLTDERRRLQVANALIQQSLHAFLFSNNTLVPVEHTGEEAEPSEEPKGESEPAKAEPTEDAATEATETTAGTAKE